MATYTRLWGFLVEPDRIHEFERHYGPQGSWALLFRRAPGYIQTMLLRGSTDPRRFITIDRWESAEAYSSFRADFSQEYAELDARCERLTASETCIGSFDESA